MSSRKRKYLIALWIISWVGLALSGELTWVYYKTYGDPNYHPSCEISTTFDCKAVALSSYARFLGLPNSLYGILVYGLIIILVPFRLKSGIRIFKHLEIYLALIALVSFAMTIRLAYASFFILDKICVWCTALYLVDLAFLVLIFLALDSPGKISQQLRADFQLLQTDPKVLGIFLLLVILLISGLIILAHRAKNQMVVPPADGPAVMINIKDDPVIGPTRARVTIIEFSDFQCPYCRETAYAIKAIQKKHNLEVRLIFKNFPLDGVCNPMLKGSPHPNSCLSAIASECAHKMGKFEPMYDKLMNANRYSADDLLKMAYELGLSPKEFSACLRDPSVYQEVLNDIKEAIKLNITGTPLLIINGKKYPHALSEQQLELIVKQILQGNEPPTLE